MVKITAIACGLRRWRNKKRVGIKFVQQVLAFDSKLLISIVVWLSCWRSWNDFFQIHSEKFGLLQAHCVKFCQFEIFIFMFIMWNYSVYFLFYTFKRCFTVDHVSQNYILVCLSPMLQIKCNRIIKPALGIYYIGIIRGSMMLCA